ncbi:hypothetical protein AVEN_185078-1 [Araneus ventricosus]|uniref:CCHC-type domain-containing protein n=1 Tax=Araneus ventricosus TaxID=182803 RepID=A0A4Y2BR03_ARAVE|nr:hypothetical protein AVEN_185078-1 [Araneus ventricosus]
MNTRCIKCNGEHATRDCNIKEKIAEPTCINCGEKGHFAAWKGCKALPVTTKPTKRQPRKAYAQAAAVQRIKEERTEEIVKEAKTEKLMDLTDLKDSLQTLREVKMLIQEFPTLLEAAKRCKGASTKQEKVLIVLSLFMGD